jgi:hypothetical protein
MLRASCTAPCPALRAWPAAELEMTSAEIFPGRESHPWSTCAWSQSYARERAEFKRDARMSADGVAGTNRLRNDGVGSIRARDLRHAM